MSGFGHCRWCQKRVLFCLKSKRGKIPLDIDASPLGEWRLELKRSGTGVTYYAHPRKPGDEVLFTCHFGTCERKPGPVRRIDPKTGAVRESE